MMKKKAVGAKKSAPARQLAMRNEMMMQNEMMMKMDESEESDAEDNAKAFGMGFNQMHNEKKKKAKKPAQNKKGSFLQNLFGGFSKESSSAQEQESIGVKSMQMRGAQ